MSRVVFSGLPAAMALVAPVLAQAPPGTPPHGETINLETARKAADAAAAEARKSNWFMAISA